MGHLHCTRKQQCITSKLSRMLVNENKYCFATGLKEEKGIWSHAGSSLERNLEHPIPDHPGVEKEKSKGERAPSWWTPFEVLKDLDTVSFKWKVNCWPLYKWILACTLLYQMRACDLQCQTPCRRLSGNNVPQIRGDHIFTEFLQTGYFNVTDDCLVLITDVENIQRQKHSDQQ